MPWFVTAREEVERRIERLGALAGTGGLWVRCPKRASALGGAPRSRSCVGQALDRGLVDYRVVRVDETWTGLYFTRRADPPA